MKSSSYELLLLRTADLVDVEDTLKAVRSLKKKMFREEMDEEIKDFVQICLVCKISKFHIPEAEWLTNALEIQSITSNNRSRRLGNRVPIKVHTRKNPSNPLQLALTSVSYGHASSADNVRILYALKRDELFESLDSIQKPVNQTLSGSQKGLEFIFATLLLVSKSLLLNLKDLELNFLQIAQVLGKSHKSSLTIFKKFSTSFLMKRIIYTFLESNRAHFVQASSLEQFSCGIY